MKCTTAWLQAVGIICLSLFPGSKNLAETQGSGYHFRCSCRESLIHRLFFLLMYIVVDFHFYSPDNGLIIN